LPRPATIAHRGASGYEYENSRAAFRRAVLLDVDGVELDVHGTRDGAIVVYHDPELPSLGRIDRLCLAEVQRHRLPNGETIPLLSEILDIVGQHRVWIEAKTLAPEHDAALLATIDAGPSPEGYAVHAFDHRIVRRLRERRPTLSIGLLLASYLLDTAALLRAAGATALWQDWRLIDADLVAEVHGAGAQLIAWTVDDPDALARLARAGIDGLCGNYPDRLRVAASANGRPKDALPGAFPDWGR
jgi:glycerophosphoryl diester phosphodiesterase